MKRIQKMIPAAMNIAGQKLVNHGAIDRELNGYISSFGASVISAGLLPSIIFYSQKGESSGRQKIIVCIEAILKNHGYPANLDLLQKVKTLFETNNSQPEINLLTEDIYDAAIALKLAIRTFPKSAKD